MPEDPYTIDQQEPNQAPPMDDGAGGESARDGETALLPKSIFGNKELEPGAKCTFEVVKTYEDEVEVKYSKEAKAKSPLESMEEAEMGLEQLATPAAYG